MAHTRGRSPGRSAPFVIALVAVAYPGFVLAQGHDARSATEEVAVGMTGGLGAPGPIVALRVSLPMSDRVGLDLTAGEIHRFHDDPAEPASDRTWGVYLHWLPHERAKAGRNGYVLGGALYLQSATITRIVWPDHTTTVLVDHHDLAYQIGYGWEWSVAHTRGGVELSTGGNQAGPIVLVKAFLLWSPTRR